MIYDVLNRCCLELTGRLGQAKSKFELDKGCDPCQRAIRTNRPVERVIRLELIARYHRIENRPEASL